MEFSTQKVLQRIVRDVKREAKIQLLMELDALSRQCGTMHAPELHNAENMPYEIACRRKIDALSALLRCRQAVVSDDGTHLVTITSAAVGSKHAYDMQLWNCSQPTHIRLLFTLPVPGSGISDVLPRRADVPPVITFLSGSHDLLLASYEKSESRCVLQILDIQRRKTVASVKFNACVDPKSSRLDVWVPVRVLVNAETREAAVLQHCLERPTKKWWIADLVEGNAVR